MKRLSVLWLTAVLIMTTGITSFAGEITVHVNNRKVHFLDMKPYMDKSNRIFVPVRFIADELGASTFWDEGKQTVTIQQADKRIEICLPCKKVLVDGKKVKTDSVGEKKDGIRTMVPLRFISEMLGANVDWNSNTMTVLISTKPTISENQDSKLNTEKDLKQISIAQKEGLKEISMQELPKSVKELVADGKVYDGTYVRWRFSKYESYEGFFALHVKYGQGVYISHVILKDGTWITADVVVEELGSLFYGNHVGKKVQKLFLFDGKDGYLVYLPEFVI